MKLESRRPLLVSLIPLTVAVLPACGSSADEAVDRNGEQLALQRTPEEAALVASRLPRYQRIRTLARLRGLPNHGYLLGGIGVTETTFAHCHSEATWACKGPNSPDCGGGPVIAGKSDGDCAIQEGGLGLFQFDAGRYADTIAKYGQEVLTVDGQVAAVVKYVVNMVKDSNYIANITTEQQALAWLNNFDINNAQLRDQWVKTVVRHFNGCQPQWSCWTPRLRTYNDGLSTAVSDTDGLAFWSAGTTCTGSNGTTEGPIDDLYLSLGGCASLLGLARDDQRTTPDTKGRYSVFEHGSIYWTAATGAHEVFARIREKWLETGAESGTLGYPVSGEYDILHGRRSDFERGSIVWDQLRDTVAVVLPDGARSDTKTALTPQSKREGAVDRMACTTDTNVSNANHARDLRGVE